jgi:hypothetical protein
MPSPTSLLSAAQGSTFAVHLADGQAEALVLRGDGRRFIAGLRPSTLNRSAVIRWLNRYDIPYLSSLEEATDDPPPLPLVRLPTLVACVDPRVADLAALYARSVDAPCSLLRDPDELSAEAQRLETHESVSIFLLSDALDQTLCQALSKANSIRRSTGRPTLTYGFLSAFTREQLSWLCVKTWALLLTPDSRDVTFAQWDFQETEPVARTRTPVSGATRVDRIDAPWTHSSVTALGVRAHGASFDVSLGRAVLCGHLEPPLPRRRTLRAPSCFHDGVCFRMRPTPDASTRRILAVDASPAVWCLDSCASLPFRDNAFGDGTSYLFGLVAGSAAGVVGPFLDVTTRGGLNTQGEALLATGATLGQVTAAACQFDPSRGFDRFLLIGSPDLRLLPPQRLEPVREGTRLRYRLKGQRQYALRLGVPPDFGPRPFVVADDGGGHWAHAQCRLVDNGVHCDLLVILDEPTDLDGWLLVGSAGKTQAELEHEASRLRDSLGVLSTYPFVDPGCDEIERCNALVAELFRPIRSPERLRSRIETALLLANLQLVLESLHRRIADCFLAEVSAHDFSLDRAAGHGFDLGATELTTRPCPTCGAALYETLANWRGNPSYVRRWVQCANCSGLLLVREDSPVEISPPFAVASPNGSSLQITFELCNRTTSAVRALVAGLARRASLAEAAGPAAITLEPNAVERLQFHSPLHADRPGVISYRLLVLCEGSLELLAINHVQEPRHVAELSLDEAGKRPSSEPATRPARAGRLKGSRA